MSCFGLGVLDGTSSKSYEFRQKVIHDVEMVHLALRQRSQSYTSYKLRHEVKEIEIMLSIGIQGVNQNTEEQTARCSHWVEHDNPVGA